jgi:Undecaprenyl-phosphate glucose phosphotransferase
VVICNSLRQALERGTLAGYPAIVIGEAECLRYLSRLEMLQRFGAREVRRFELLSGDQQRNLAVIDEAIEAARSHHVERVLLALNWSDEPLRKLVCEGLQVLPRQVSLLPDRNVISILSHRAKQLAAEFTVEVQRTPLSAAEALAKRVLDLVLGSAILISLLPLLAIVAILIKVDSPGPVIFRQRRRGFNCREFTIYKFRTMRVLEDGENIRQAQRNDARITRMGRVLRATSIDELPQLVNVLRGQMSLVGPRPHPTSLDDRYSQLIGDYASRQRVKPGLTGWAQVHGLRGETAALELMEGRIAFDIWYIKNWSIWLDLRIVILTFFELVRGRNAY